MGIVTHSKRKPSLAAEAEDEQTENPYLVGPDPEGGCPQD